MSQTIKNSWNLLFLERKGKGREKGRERERKKKKERKEFHVSSKEKRKTAILKYAWSILFFLTRPILKEKLFYQGLTNKWAWLYSNPAYSSLLCWDGGGRGIPNSSPPSLPVSPEGEGRKKQKPSHWKCFVFFFQKARSQEHRNTQPQCPDVFTKDTCST